MTNVAFDAFSCYAFEQSQWLKADVAIQCGSPDHVTAVSLAWVAIILYPCGLLVLYATLLFAVRAPRAPTCALMESPHLPDDFPYSMCAHECSSDMIA